MPESRPVSTPARVVTFGCRLNSYESEVVKDHAMAAGLGDSIIFNTCAVTVEAVRQVRQAIRREARNNPQAAIIVTGCAAQIDPDSFASMPQVDRVIGNHEKMQARTWEPASLFDAPEKIRVNDIMSVRETAGHLIDGMAGRARAYVQIQNGCDHRCTFCVIPHGRGNARSVPAGRVVEMVRRLTETGHHEIVLTGVDLTSWGCDLPGTGRLGNLVQRILKHVPQLGQLRISSIDASEIDDALFDVMADSRVAPFMHLSLQHGDNIILKRMKRRHTGEDAMALIGRLRAIRPDMAFGADVIAGFPTESETAFDNTCKLVADGKIAFLHVFAYSPRPGTPAARMPQLTRPVVKSRAARLRSVGRHLLAEHLQSCLQSRPDRQFDVLVEQPDHGRLPDFTPVRLSGVDAASTGSIARVHITGHDGKKLIGIVS